MQDRELSFPDQLICAADKALRTVAPHTQPHKRPSPAADIADSDDTMTKSEIKHSAGLMRINHCGEVCAQALYEGQALSARLPEVREEMENAADEEVDHLAWCEQRLKELDSHTSLLNPLWYSISFSIGATAGLMGDKISLGFVAATEEQVCAHLENHMQSLPEKDQKSRAIITQMLEDEEKHAHTALKAGGLHFITPVKAAMTLISKVMTCSSYRI